MKEDFTQGCYCDQFADPTECRDADCCLMQEEFEQDRKARGTLAIIIYVIVVIVIALAFSIGHHNGLIP